jgi:cytochrome c5
MQGPTSHHVSPIKNWQQLVVVVVLAFVVPIAVIALLAQYVTDVSVPADVDAASRIKPVGEVVVESAGSATPGGTAAPAAAQASTASASPPKAAAPTASAPAAAGATTAAAAAPAAAKPDGKKVFDTTCTACHTPGVAGAPKLGDKAAWVPRLKQGMDALYASALKGKGAMPPKGGNASLPDADVKAAVDYMAAAAK